MGILGSIGLDSIIKELGETARQVLPNKEAQRDFQLKLEELRDRAEARVHEEAIAQTEVNKVEAAHASIFVAGWRPAIGWVCVSGLAWNFALAPALSTVGLQPGTLDIEGLITLVLTMLGASGLRTYELGKGVARDNMKGPRTGAPVAVKQQLAQTQADTGVPVYDDTQTTVPTNEEDAPWNRVS